MSAEAKLKELNLSLPPAPKPMGVYKPMVTIGNLAYLSGHGPLREDGSLIIGRVGEDMDLDGGYEAARQTGLAMIATLQAGLGSLDRVQRVIKTLGFVNSANDFVDQPKVINGCSELFAELFGPEIGVGARSALPTNTLPGGIAVEIEMILEITPGMKPLTGLEVANLDEIPSPSLLVWPERVQANIGRMIDLVGGNCSRLRPHVKTHKMEAVVRLQMEAGIRMFKAATIAEVEMCLMAGARDVLLAFPLVGPNQGRLANLAWNYPDAKLSFIADDPELVRAAAKHCGDCELGVFIDFDCGMHRTGTGSTESAVEVARAADECVHLFFQGIHVYDGHVRDDVVGERETHWSAAMERVDELSRALQQAGLPVESVVGGGSPTFGFHAASRGWQCSPGTTLFWDAGYGSRFPDLPFEPAALVLTRIVSKPDDNLLCLDLGHKAIAAENPIEKRVRLIGLEEAVPVGHSEEHFVVKVEDAGRFAVGDAFLGVPQHICPTVALHQEAVLVRDGRTAGESWPVTARNRRITV